MKGFFSEDLTSGIVRLTEHGVEMRHFAKVGLLRFAFIRNDDLKFLCNNAPLSVIEGYFHQLYLFSQKYSTCFSFKLGNASILCYYHLAVHFAKFVFFLRYLFQEIDH